MKLPAGAAATSRIRIRRIGVEVAIPGSASNQFEQFRNMLFVLCRNQYNLESLRLFDNLVQLQQYYDGAINSRSKAKPYYPFERFADTFSL